MRKSLTDSESAAYLSFVHKKPNLTQMEQEFKILTCAGAWLAQYFGCIKMF